MRVHYNWHPDNLPVQDYSMDRAVIDWMQEYMEPCLDIVEFGSGTGTPRLTTAGHKVVSIEHDPKWVQEESILVPVENGWYSHDHLKPILQKNCDLIIVDGTPTIGGRDLIFEWYKLPEVESWFQKAVVIIDDTDSSQRGKPVLEKFVALGWKIIYNDSPRWTVIQWD
jgi:hypothetical protein